ncbi:hypothetical protein [Marinococcus halotolerans]|uniref:hypothetical protein n=1 Tax=Marinococcus halotolerans TaxID=301092 RepID=UPI0003B3F7AB|nr:hypothetical protein [Marinococcus halotolerans]
MSGPALRKVESHSSIHEAALTEASELTELLESLVSKNDNDKAYQIQTSLLGFLYATEASWASVGYIGATVCQGLLSILVIVGYLKAINYNYHLILEKTHRIPRKITVHGCSGTRRSFLMIPDLFKRKKNT